MPTYGDVADITKLFACNSKFTKPLEYLAKCLTAGTEEHDRCMALATDGSNEVQLGDGAFAIEQCYTTKEEAGCRYESHQKYIDIQCIVSGREIMKTAHKNKLQLADEYDEEKDVAFYAEGVSSLVIAAVAGSCCIFMPEDAHKPCIAMGEPMKIVKTVVKVPVT